METQSQKPSILDLQESTGLATEYNGMIQKQTWQDLLDRGRVERYEDRGYDAISKALCAEVELRGGAQNEPTDDDEAAHGGVC